LRIVVVTDAVLKYFLEYSTTFVAKYLHASNVAPCTIYTCPWDKICIALFLALWSLYKSKIMEYYIHIQ